MSLLKVNKNKLSPWTNNDLKPFLFTDDFFSNLFFEDDTPPLAMNFKEFDDSFNIEFAVPSFSKKDFEVTTDNNISTISGKKEEESTAIKYEYSQKEFSYNSFKRNIKLPNAVNANKKINTMHINRILKLNLAKKEANKKAIEVV